MARNESEATPHKQKKTKGGRYVADITLAELESCFHLPSEKACAQLRIGLTMLKRICRRFGIDRWPYSRKPPTKPATWQAQAPAKSRKQAPKLKQQTSACTEGAPELSLLDAPRPIRAARLNAANFAAAVVAADFEESDAESDAEDVTPQQSWDKGELGVQRGSNSTATSPEAGCPSSPAAAEAPADDHFGKTPKPQQRRPVRWSPYVRPRQQGQHVEGAAMAAAVAHVAAPGKWSSEQGQHASASSGCSSGQWADIVNSEPEELSWLPGFAPAAAATACPLESAGRHSSQDVSSSLFMLDSSHPASATEDGAQLKSSFARATVGPLLSHMPALRHFANFTRAPHPPLAESDTAKAATGVLPLLGAAGPGLPQSAPSHAPATATGSPERGQLSPSTGGGGAVLSLGEENSPDCSTVLLDSTLFLQGVRDAALSLSLDSPSLAATLSTQLSNTSSCMPLSPYPHSLPPRLESAAEPAPCHARLATTTGRSGSIPELLHKPDTTAPASSCAFNQLSSAMARRMPATGTLIGKLPLHPDAAAETCYGTAGMRVAVQPLGLASPFHRDAALLQQQQQQQKQQLLPPPLSYRPTLPPSPSKLVGGRLSAPCVMGAGVGGALNELENAPLLPTSWLPFSSSLSQQQLVLQQEAGAELAELLGQWQGDDLSVQLPIASGDLLSGISGAGLHNGGLCNNSSLAPSPLLDASLPDLLGSWEAMDRLLPHT